MKNLIFLAASFLSISSFATVSPSSVKIKIFGVAVSLTADCANPVTVFSSDTGTEVDFITGPTLGSGNPADGTYNCVMITMSDQIKATPATTEGACVAGTEITGGVCQNTESTELLSGTTFATTSCTTGDDRVTLFLQTGTTRITGGNAFRKPTTTTDTTLGFMLDGAFVVAGTAIGTFVTDFTNKMVDGGTECGLSPPLFKFR